MADFEGRAQRSERAASSSVAVGSGTVVGIAAVLGIYRSIRRSYAGRSAAEHGSELHVEMRPTIRWTTGFCPSAAATLTSPLLRTAR